MQLKNAKVRFCLNVEHIDIRKKKTHSWEQYKKQKLHSQKADWSLAARVQKNLF